ncbi:MAG: hypothetical protein ACT4OU_02565 [Hyphomicrobium sp.]
MRLAFLAAAVAAVASLAAPQASARPFYEETGYGVDSWGSTQRVAGRQHRREGRAYSGSRNNSYYRTASANRGLGGRPRRWCGWWMRTQKGGGPEFNVAANWRRWGSPAGGPMVGAVVVWAHHVGMITGRAANGQWIVKSGNDGGRVRERARSVAGATFRVG